MATEEFEDWELGMSTPLGVPVDSLIVAESFRGSCDLAPLLDNIREQGLWNPVIVLPNGMVIDGNHRVICFRALGWKKIPVIIRQTVPAMASMIMNLTAHTVTPDKYVEGLRRFLAVEGMSPEEMVKALQTSQDWIEKQLGLTK